VNAPYIALIFLLHAALTGLPIVAGILVAASLGVKNRLLLIGLGMSTLMAVGFLTFWVFYLGGPQTGQIFAFVVTSVLVLTVGALSFKSRGRLRFAVGLPMIPALVWVTAALLIFSFGAAYNRNAPVAEAATTRFSHPLPIDNQVPLYLANALEQPGRPLPHPLYVVWTSSARPPLQAGVYLFQESLLPGRDSNQLHYQIVGVLLQSLWVLGAWAFLTSIGASAGLVALTLAGTLFSGLIIVNTFFVWPKLFAAAYVLVLAAFLITPQFRTQRNSALAGLTAGGLAAGALLAHEGTGLALLAFGIVMLFQRKLPSLRFLLPGVAVLVVTFGSWAAYQQFIDPPGDQIARLEIANQANLLENRQSLSSQIISAYSSKPISAVVHNKISNLTTPFSHLDEFVTSTFDTLRSYVDHSPGWQRERTNSVFSVRAVTFFFLVPSVGLISLGLFAWLWGLLFRPQVSGPFRVAGTLWVFLFVNVVTWALILFGPNATVNHAGTFATGILAMIACIIGLWEISPWFAIIVTGLQAVIVIVVYGLNGPLPSPAKFAGSLEPGMTIMSVIALCLTCAALVLVARGSGNVQQPLVIRGQTSAEIVPEEPTPAHRGDGSRIRMT
jgi:hypothetical protein